MATITQQYKANNVTPEQVAQIEARFKPAVNTQSNSQINPQVSSQTNITPENPVVTRIAGNVDITPGMDASKIASQQNLVIPERQTPTASAALGGQIDAQANQYAQSLISDQNLNNLQGQTNTAQNKLVETMNQLLGKGAKQQELSTQAGLPEKQQLVTSLTNQIQAKSLAYRRQIEKLQANADPADSAGKFGTGVATAVGEMERKGNMELADLAIQQSAANNDLATASSLVEAKLKAEFEPLEQSLNYLKYFYEDNRAQLTKAQDRRFQAVIDERTRLLGEQKDEKSAIAQIQLEAIKNGADNATIQRIQSAKDRQEALSAGSKYIGLLDRQKAELERTKTLMEISKLKADTQEVINKNAPAATPQARAQAQGNINLISDLTNNKYLGTAVGANPLGRVSFLNAFTGGKSDFVAGVEQLRSQLTLDSLVNAKARGATFGALSEGELKTLQASASKLGTWAIKDKDGNITGYKTSEDSFKRELDKINNFAKLDYILKGGAPSDVNVNITNDGLMWTKNSDGTLTQLN